MHARDFHFDLPGELIAQHPAEYRDQSRLLVFDRKTTEIEHRHFSDLPQFLCAGDILVLNDSRVIPARLRGSKANSGARVEMLLVEEIATNDWWVMIRPGKRIRPGTRILLKNSAGLVSAITATVICKNREGHCRLRFDGVADVLTHLDTLGEVPLPPYIRRNKGTIETTDRERYQTVFATQSGSVAAPTAGLHFTSGLLASLRSRGVKVVTVTLHVGLGTFAPVKSELVSNHTMHEERFDLPEETARAVIEAKKSGNRVFAIGTTSTRVLESSAVNSSELKATRGKTNLFVFPPYRFQVVDAMVTNFHLPESTLLMLVSAFAAPNETRGRELALSVYAEAIREGYRFFSYGDAMLIL
ncbi:MAG: tRNA preQ1(34) S-adenosylmethionine ribosyltransferase-isomerase QueA [Verrucomicrobia bacterium]|nr:tRNA preQ1(34) S-adenosylmethionine ribosyltransferase-isomerase QueA [Verrucomicrobiota bacterium]